jgi:hypothetical protein
VLPLRREPEVCNRPLHFCCCFHVAPAQRSQRAHRPTVGHKARSGEPRNLLT